ncbi:helix-turn-helix domain-containing protein [Lysinibacillus piscis]|uniref:Transcriptional regulator n=1 Tax=Lysinibacillus piscis TaxID=2518931 RepID=A0ABQ5NML5_9BACI|nr:helix-turn-helix transcriptional regulator [Lysinibacillus sp. KH24]GLC89607.1 transcriptional regulator [Lysinibacillus sp. KH24]
MENWGRLIKYHRQQQGLKQDVVAVGICTPSYLSRIENGMVVAELTMYELLLERLGINLTAEKEQLAISSAFLETVYEKLLSNIELTINEIDQLHAMQSTTFHQEVDVVAKLVYSRYLLSQNQLQKAQKLLSQTESFIAWQHDRVTQLYIGTTTYAHLSALEFYDISTKEEQQQLSHYMTTANRFEQANYFYHVAFAYHRGYSFQQALHYIHIATQTFSHQYKPLFQLKLYSMAGVIYNSLHRFNEALTEYGAGEDLIRNVESLQTPQQFSSLYNNIAFCYECQRDFAKAQDYYAQAVHHLEDLHTIINWMRVCYRGGYTEKLQELFEKYPKQCFTIGHHQYQWELLHYASTQPLGLMALKEIEMDAFPYFEEQHHYELLLYYMPLWGTFYEKLHAYKQANHCYKRAFRASEKVRQLMSS